MSNPPSAVYPIAHSEAEAVLFRLFDQFRHSIDDWEVATDGATIEQIHHSVKLT